MKYYLNFLWTYLFFINLTAFGQTSEERSIISQELPINIYWSQILSNENSYFIVGFQDDDAVLYNLKSNSSIIISAVGMKMFSFISNDELFFGPLGSSFETDSSKIKVLKFDFNGKSKGVKNIIGSGVIANYSTIPNTKDILYVTIELMGYMGGMMDGIIYTSKNSRPVIKFEYIQSPPPLRIALPVIAIKEKIYLAFENEYNINVYSKSGKLIESFTYPDFNHQPYSKIEVELLSPMQKTTTQAGITYPPIIQKIDISGDGKIFITRFLRPGSLQLFVDVFNGKGRYLNTLEFQLDKNEKLIDACLISKDKYACLLSLDNSTSIVRIYKFN
ncbi:MAG: hypothetical protein Q8K98_14200 [Bacteroidota bacterium]|nr:hypothetical protein [Bacteroidota bacterium]